MESSKEKLQRFGIRVVENKKYTNQELLDLCTAVKKCGKECTFVDLAKTLQIPPKRLFKIINNVKLTLRPLSGVTRTNFLEEPFNCVAPSSTATLSQSFGEVVDHSILSTTQDLLQQIQSMFQHEETVSAVLKDCLRVKATEDKLLSRKHERLQKRFEKQTDNAKTNIGNLQSQLSREVKEKKCVQKEVSFLKESVLTFQEEEAVLVKNNEYLINQLSKHTVHDSDAETITNMKKRIQDLSQDLAYAEHLIDPEINTIHTTMEDGRSFNTKTVDCVMKLLDKGVSAHNVGGVMADVAEMFGKTLSVIPSTTTINRINDRRASIVRQQLADTLAQDKNTTLMSDETRKHGDSYEVYAVSSEDRDYVLGLRDIIDKSSDTCLNTFKTVLSDIEDTSSTDAGKRILINIKNTMSDRAATEKKLHALLQDYRKDVLPQVNDNWGTLSEAEQEAHAHMNNFYCGLHLLVNFAEIAGKVCKLYEDTQEKGEEEAEGQDSKRDECRTVRLVRQASKCLARGADDKSGCYQEFRTYLVSERQEEEEKTGIRKELKLLLPFKGNRFNILFVNAEHIFYLHDDIQDFFKHVHIPSNGLQKAVADSISVDLLQAIIKALGICSKLVTGPFWRTLEQKHTTLQDANGIYGKLFSFLREAKADATDVMSGELAPFPENIVKDDVFHKLTTPHPQDASTCAVLQLIFDNKAAADHLPGGRYWLVDEALATETASVPRHNKLPERIFGLLDALTKFRPVASTLCNETYIMFSLNQTSEWMRQLSEEKLDKYMDFSRKEGREIRQKYQERLKNIQQERRDSLKRRRKEKEDREKKRDTEKLTIFNDMNYYGLWQSCTQVDTVLGTITFLTEKKKALKTQLLFRKVVLGQAGDKKLFSVQRKGQGLYG